MPLTHGLTHGALHAAIGRHFIDHGTAPTIAQLAVHFALDAATVADALQALADYHGVVLHPTSGEIWASSDEGASWARIAEHLPEIYSVEFADPADRM